MTVAGPTTIAPATKASPSPNSIRPLEWLNFLVADVQTGVGPFLAAYLAASHWNPRDTGFALTLGGLVTVAAGPFAGGVIDRSNSKRTLIAFSLAILAAGALVLAFTTKWSGVAPAQVLIGLAGAIIGPALAAIALGMVGPSSFDRQFGRNQGFNSAGNVVTALLLAGISYLAGLRSIFFVTAALTIPAFLVLKRINPADIDNNRARGERPTDGKSAVPESWWRALLTNRTFALFLLCCFLFHLANAAMLPELGEMLARGNAKLSAPFMSACIIVTQLVIAASASWFGRMASTRGRKPLLLVGFGVLPIRGVLYTLTHATWALIGIQLLDGVANAIFVVVSILVVADLMRSTGRFNLAQGALGTVVGLGASASNAFGGVLAHRYGFSASFLGLAAVALAAFLLLWLTIPETKDAAPVPAK